MQESGVYWSQQTVESITSFWKLNRFRFVGANMVMKPKIGREDLIKILQHWRDGVLTAEQVHEWAEERAGNAEVGDWEGAEPDSVANEVLFALDMLNMNLMLPEDIPNFLEFLYTPTGHFSEGYCKWQDALTQIDYQTRKEFLRMTPLYARFCK